MALDLERKKASFNPELLTFLLDSGEGTTDRRREIESKAIEGLDVVEKNGPTWFFKSNPQRYDDAIRKGILSRQKQVEHGFTDLQESNIVSEAISPHEPGPFLLHYGMFVTTIQSQASEEQRDELLRKIDAFEIVGTYAQTEMGHGTHLRGLETTATYDLSTEEFVINSPTLTSTKWWPGGMGKTVNHVVLMANLVIKGKSYGMHSFILQLRDIATHRSLPGIEVGDIGPKIGFNGNDNGFLRCDHVRIPRTNMLMKNSEVLPNGTYVNKSKAGKAVYGTMVLTRLGIVIGGAVPSISKAATIAIRYSCVRRQSEIVPGEPEPQILDFVTQQFKLFSVLAEAFALTFAGEKLKISYMEAMAQMMSGDANALPEIHALTSGVKAFGTDTAAQGIETCRRACGGHGFSQASGFQKIFVACVAACTYEGENTVLYLQTARFLMKAVDQGASGTESSTKYLFEGGNRQKSRVGQDMTLLNLAEEMQYSARQKVMSAKRAIQEMQRGGLDVHFAWNAAGIELVVAAKAHVQAYVLTNFVEVVNEIEDADLRRVMTNVCMLHGCCCLIQNADILFAGGYLSGQQMDWIKSARGKLLSAIRPEAVALVDAFDYSDHALGSVLGRHDGQVYEHLYEWAKQSPLNKTDVHESFHKYVVPYRKKLALEQSKL